MGKSNPGASEYFESIEFGKQRRAKVGTENLKKARAAQHVPHVVREGIEYKSCSQCGSLKTLNQFWNRSVAWDGKESACIACSKHK